MRVKALADHFDGSFRKAGEEFEYSGELHAHIQPLFDSDQLRERFHRVILGAGYSEIAAQSILQEWFGKYLQDVRSFTEMLERYETLAREFKDANA